MVALLGWCGMERQVTSSRVSSAYIALPTDCINRTYHHHQPYLPNNSAGMRTKNPNAGKNTTNNSEAGSLEHPLPTHGSASSDTTLPEPMTPKHRIAREKTR
jgi:hypothetical protein